jgi:hypothetical protein
VRGAAERERAERENEGQFGRHACRAYAKAWGVSHPPDPCLMYFS